MSKLPVFENISQEVLHVVDPVVSAKAASDARFPMRDEYIPESARRLERLFTVGQRERLLNPYESVTWTKRDVILRDECGTILFEQREVEAPSSWSDQAVQIVASKYFHRARVPTEAGRETSVREVVLRLVSAWRQFGEEYGYFASKEDADIFADEAAFMLINQVAAPNSPQWFNTGLHLYGIRGTPTGRHFYTDIDGEIRPCSDLYSRPQAAACYIQSVQDDLLGPGGIMDLWMRETALFKGGSGSGTNFSQIRGLGEPLSSGGVSSGLMSFLLVGDRAAGAIKSGGTTRRAAKMVCLDADHPDIEAFVSWKVEEERKVRALIAAGYSPDFNGAAYQTVSGQNSNNSVRLSDDFLQATLNNRPWQLLRRTDGGVTKVVQARELWERIAAAAHECADPGVQFSTTINTWHTCPESGAINASNPCGEYLFIDESSCNLASINIAHPLFIKPTLSGLVFDAEALRHAVRIWTRVLEITNSMMSSPGEEIARNTRDHRTIGLGITNAGALLMRSGIPYDSPRGRSTLGAIMAIVTGESYAESARMAETLGPFPAFDANREHMLRIIRNHRRAAYGALAEDYEDLSVPPRGLDPIDTPKHLLTAARAAWDEALRLGERFGYRNAQATVIAPTGTIGPLMDCDTTGPEPDFALVKFKKLAGGGTMKFVNQSIAPGLRSLGYPEGEIRDILLHIEKRGTASGAPHLRAEHRSVFHCAEELTPEAHLLMMASLQPFVSGGISKTVNLPRETTPDDIRKLYFTAWQLGLKSVAVFRAGSKTQVLEALRATDLEPPMCVACGEGGVCDLPEAKKRSKGPWNAIPELLRSLRFVAYGLDKVPLDCRTGRAASVSWPDSWSTFEEAVSFIEKSPRALGPGLVLRPEDRVVCIDLDDVIDPAEGAKPFAEELTERFATYTERSLSGKGLHIFFRVAEPPNFPGGKWKMGQSDRSFEIYHASRYIALTGKLWKFSGAGSNLEDRTAELRAFIAVCEPVHVQARRGPGGQGRPVNTEAMLDLFTELGVGVGVDTRKTLVRCFLPSHDDQRASLSIDPLKGWYCHGCAMGGGAHRLRQIVRELSDEDVHIVAQRTGRNASALFALRERLRRIAPTLAYTPSAHAAEPPHEHGQER